MDVKLNDVFFKEVGIQIGKNHLNIIKHFYDIRKR